MHLLCSLLSYLLSPETHIFYHNDESPLTGASQNRAIWLSFREEMLNSTVNDLIFIANIEADRLRRFCKAF